MTGELVLGADGKSEFLQGRIVSLVDLLAETIQLPGG